MRTYFIIPSLFLIIRCHLFMTKDLILQPRYVCVCPALSSKHALTKTSGGMMETLIAAQLSIPRNVTENAGDAERR